MFWKRKNKVRSDVPSIDTEMILTTFNSNLDSANVSIEIIQSTKNPDTFFANYHNIIDCFERMEAMIEKYPLKVSDGTIHTHRAKFLDEYITYKDDFIDRYYEQLQNKIDTLKTENAINKNIHSYYQKVMIYDYEFSDAELAKLEIYFREIVK